MTQRFTRGTLTLLLCLGMVGVASAQDALSIPDASTPGLTPVDMSVMMDASADVQGFVLAIGYDNALVEVTGADVAGAAAGISELVVGEFFHADGGFTLGVVLDASAPFDGQVIPAGAGIMIASFSVQPLLVGSPTDAAFDFVDGVFNDPVLNNILVQGGLSIGVGQGLMLNGGILGSIPLPDELTIADASYVVTTEGTFCGDVEIQMDNPEPVQGFVLAIAHDGAAVTLDSIDVGPATAAAGAEFVVPDTAPPGGPGGTLGVVLDFSAPFDGQTIPAGADQHIATYTYCVPGCSDLPPGGVSSALSFVDGVLGSPLLDNVIVVGGLSINPLFLNDGSVTFTPDCIDGDGIAFYADCGEGLPGDTVDVCFSYTSAQNLQGVQLAVCFDCCLTFGTFSIEGSIFEAVGAEFVNYNVDNDPDDGDGCEFVAGILLDALPPFEGQTVPQTDDPLLIGCIDATICADAPCEACLEVYFCNGIDGAGDVAIENIAVVDFQSVQDIAFINCCVFVPSIPTFKRGDCNDDDKVDLADSATILGEQFFGLAVICEDACDANDDGKINLADSVYILNYLFKFGAAPPDPGPDMDGPDPTEDALGCESTGC